MRGFWGLLFLIMLFPATSLAGHSLMAVKVDLVQLKSAGWKHQTVRDAVEVANSILSQCRIYMQVNSSQTVPGGAVKLMSDTFPNHRESEINLHKSLNHPPSAETAVRIFFVGQVVGHPGALGVSRRSELHAGEIFENSVYIANKIKSENVGQTLAHEMGHVLLDEGHHHDVPPNIMHYDHTRQNMEFDNRQCEKMRSSLLTSHQ